MKIIVILLLTSYCFAKPFKVALGSCNEQRKVQKIWKYVDKLETRKVILPTKQMLKNSALESCLNFEKGVFEPVVKSINAINQERSVWAQISFIGCT